MTVVREYKGSMHFFWHFVFFLLSFSFLSNKKCFFFFVFSPFSHKKMIQNSVLSFLLVLCLIQLILIWLINDKPDSVPIDD